MAIFCSFITSINISHYMLKIPKNNSQSVPCVYIYEKKGFKSREREKMCWHFQEVTRPSIHLAKPKRLACRGDVSVWGRKRKISPRLILNRKRVRERKLFALLPSFRHLLNFLNMIQCLTCSHTHADGWEVLHNPRIGTEGKKKTLNEKKREKAEKSFVSCQRQNFSSF